MTYLHNVIVWDGSLIPEIEQLAGAAPPMEKCTNCGDAPLDQFARGMIHSADRQAAGEKYCAVICNKCEHLIGWE